MTAAYGRLSVENGGNETDDTLQTQIALLHQYIGEHPEMELVDTYTDNGYSGTNFDRPEFIRMMDDVRNGRIQCIVVKDLSRFGRNYLETGYYIETLLPHLNVRLIAVTDNFDSSREEDRNSLAVPMKNMVNAMYAKDFSKKLSISAAMRRKNENVLPNGLPPYGYTFSEDRTHYVEKPNTAMYVRVVFQMARLGVKQSEIARRMNFIGAATPGEQLTAQQKKIGRKKYEWTGSTVGGVLRNPAYAGDVALGRMRTALYKSEPMHRVPASEWTVREDAHIPLVTREDRTVILDAIAEVGKKNSAGAKECEVYRETMVNVFEGKVVCAECNRKMNFARFKHTYIKAEKAVPCYFCPPLNGQAACGGKNVYLDFLKIVVMDQIHAFIQSVCDRKDLLLVVNRKQNSKNPVYVLQKKSQALSNARNQAEERQATLYENYAEGILEREDYQMLRECEILAIKKINEELEIIDAKKLQLEQHIQSFLAMADRLEGQRENYAFDSDFAQELIEQIRIGNGGRIELVFKCRDVYQEIMEMTGG